MGKTDRWDGFQRVSGFHGCSKRAQGSPLPQTRKTGLGLKGFSAVLGVQCSEAQITKSLNIFLTRFLCSHISFTDEVPRTNKIE